MGKAVWAGFRVGIGRGDMSEGVAGWVWGMAQPGAQKGSRKAGESKKRAEGGVLSVQGRMKKEKGVGMV
jgi:hypothetical protein